MAQHRYGVCVCMLSVYASDAAINITQYVCMCMFVRSCEQRLSSL